MISHPLNRRLLLKGNYIVRLVNHLELHSDNSNYVNMSCHHVACHVSLPLVFMVQVALATCKKLLIVYNRFAIVHTICLFDEGSNCFVYS